MYKHFDKVLLRIPSFPLNSINCEPDEANAIFGTGLYLASVDLWEEWIKNSNKKTITSKLSLSIRKYWIRSCSRSTPYGTFAGCSVVNVSDKVTSLYLNTNSEIKKKARLDMNYLTLIGASLVPYLKQDSKLFLNNSLYRVHNQFRFVEYSTHLDSRYYSISSVESSDYLEAIIEQCKNGVHINELVGNLAILFPEYTKKDFKVFIDELISAQIVNSEIEISVTGKPVSEQLEMILNIVEPPEIQKRALMEINERMKRNDLEVEDFQDIVSILNKSFPDIPYKKNTIQVDTYFSFVERNLNKKVVDKIIHQISDLFVFSRKSIPPDLKLFISKFLKKYEYQEIPLSVALDPDLGIGYSNFLESDQQSNLLDDLCIQSTELGTEKFEIDYINEFVVKKYNDYTKKQQSEINITEADINEISKYVDNVNLPRSMSIIGSLLAGSPNFQNDNFLFLLNFVGGTSGANLLSRFAYGDDEVLSLINGIVEKEEDSCPDAILAEIVHLPQARIGNILLRPSFRKYEIPYVGKSGLPVEQQIEVNDLFVSIRENTVYLRSKRLNKRVIPRLTTAHNYSFKNLPLYKFLCDLQVQGYAMPIIWDWGVLSKLSSLPRVVYKDIIIRKATWRVDLNEFGKNNSTEFSMTRIKVWQQSRRIPDHVCYVQNDNYIVIDFSTENGLFIFEDILKKNKSIKIEEFLHVDLKSPIINEKLENYHNEIVIPIFKNIESAKAGAVNPIDVKVDLFEARDFVPLNKWLYFKLYIGKKSAENFIRKLYVTLKGFKKRKYFDKFFFIRFADEDGHHLRFRFYKKDNNFESLLTLFYQICTPYLISGALSKISIDTYKRELERYGADFIEETENLFEIDSFHVLALLSLLPEQQDLEDFKMYYAIKAIDTLFDSFQLNLIERHNLISKMHDSFYKEFGGERALLKQLNRKYANFQERIQAVESADSKLIVDLNELLMQKRRLDENVIVEINKKRKLSQWNKGVISSYIHMSINRLFSENQRQYELVIYHFLEREYYSQKLKINGKNKLIF